MPASGLRKFKATPPRTARQTTSEGNVDNLTPACRRNAMAHVRSTGTSPELAIEEVLRRQGFRPRLHVRDLPGCPDFVFPRSRKIVFVHGCFWHRHICCKGMSMPATRVMYWREKFERNRKRDAATRRNLGRLGWGVEVVWECQLKHLDRVTSRLRRFLGTGVRRPK